ncbi:MAG: protein-export membrane protein SecD [Chloroflexi bacterium RBG_19FT_COMBO_47_9]|nr:MAG: protein-export membrane protein SecD [Chloroflexi bacterium RBG_19FT_COMBO_47_9]
MSRTYRLLILIASILLVAVYIDLPESPGIHFAGINRDFTTRLGLDLVGGVQALLEADVPSTQTIDPNDMSVAVQIVDNRVNALGVSEAVVQPAGQRRIVVELPGETDPETALATIKQTGLLEFVDMSGISDQVAASLVHTKINTDWAPGGNNSSQTITLEPTATVTPTITSGVPITPTVEPTSTAPPTLPVNTGPTFHTVMTGAELKNVGVETTQGGGYVVGFELSPEGTQIFKDFTSSHVGYILGIVLDKEVISIPSINTAITGGQGVIEGRFTSDEANTLAVQLKYGSLPIPLKVVTSSTVGPTLGQDSLRKSLTAGLIGMSVVILFMALYYRLPGVVADLALLCYALFTYALFRLIPVTLTLPGIAGFILSVGVAVDANVLIFERIKEELRAGRALRQAIDLGWNRAWPSIRDSNFSTLITCGILFWFGNTFGASIVKGFSLTLAIGVMVSMFTAIVVSRTFLHLVLDNINFTRHSRWFGV